MKPRDAGRVSYTSQTHSHLPTTRLLRKIADRVMHDKVIIAPDHSRGKGHYANRRLTEDQVRDIRKRYNGRREVTIALEFEYGMSAASLRSVAVGKNYAWVI